MEKKVETETETETSSLVGSEGVDERRSGERSVSGMSERNAGHGGTITGSYIHIAERCLE